MLKKSLDELNRLSLKQYTNLKKIPIVIILDNIRSMANVGSTFRIADAFKLQHLFLCGITAKPPHREIHKTALGAEESVSWTYIKDTKEIIQQLINDNYLIVGVEQTHKSVELQKFQFNNNIKYAFVFGNEVSGVHSETLEHCNKFIEIPQFGTKHSLNVSVSVAITMWEVLKKYI